MSPKFYKYFGLILIIISSFYILNRLYFSFFVYNKFLLTFLFKSIVTFFIGTLPGIYYYKFGKENKKENGLIKIALLLKMISLIMVIVVLILFVLTYILLEGVKTPLAGVITIVFIVVGTIIPPALYLTGVVLLVVCIGRTKNEKRRVLEKK